MRVNRTNHMPIKYTLNRAINFFPFCFLIEKNVECNQSFYVLAEFMHHINNTPLHTQQNRIDCFICKESIERMKAAKHLLSHNIGLFQCIYCTFGTADFGEIKVHLSDSHPTKLALVTARIRGGDLRVNILVTAYIE